MIILLIIIAFFIYKKNQTVKTEPKSLFGSNCAPFSSPPCGGSLTFNCYRTTDDNCFSGRQLSESIQLPDVDYADFLLYYVTAISDSNGGYYNVPSQTPIDLNISIYNDVTGPDFRMCGTYDSELQNYDYENASATLAAGQYYWLCTRQKYYIGVNSGDSANIPTDQFYVCLSIVSEDQIGYPMSKPDVGNCVVFPCSSRQ